MRIARFAILATLFAASCANLPDSQECETGITCPEGTKCAAVQPICITNDCGDGVVQASVGEVCDDGNVEDGDGCAANCQSREVCGDGVINAAAGELCDDGNTTGGDGCSADCTSVEVCGNNIRDVNEACDDGNTVPGDGCSGNCKSTEICGNNIVDLDEKCDDGGAPGGCNDDCQGGTGCGDGAIDRDGSGNALEECDDGNTDDHDDCTNLCKLNMCGDGNVQASGTRVEDCDPSVNFGETATCNIDCTAATCGDGKINNVLGEECDAGAGLNADDRDCTSTCHLNRCGDALPNTTGPSHKEDCDDGNSVNSDMCPNTCKMPVCGNGLVEAMNNEACDDGNTMNGDGCSSTCRFEKCGDGLINNGEQCDGTGTATVAGTPGETATCNADCTTRSCGDGKVNKTSGEQCDDQNMNDSGDACRNNCKLNVCGDGSKSGTEACDDGNTVNTDTCSNACTLTSCGDGIRQGTEECDDGNTSETDGCLNNCTYNKCGDGKLLTGVEQCDNGANNGVTKDCLPNCKTNVCGDGFRDQEGTGAPQTEACDDGNTMTESACAYGVSSCSACSSDCDTALSLSGNICGDGVIDMTNEECDDNNTVTEGACPYNSPGGTCTVCSSTCHNVSKTGGDYCGDGTTDAMAGEVCDDNNANACGQCSAACGTIQTATAATGFMVAPLPSNALDGRTFTIDDGQGHIVVFELDTKNDGVTAMSGNIDVDARTGDTTAQTRDTIKNAINGTALKITASDAGTTGISLVNQVKGTAGNHAITTTLSATDFYVSGMSGGVAHDCPMNTGCKSNDDCSSGLCTLGVCQ